MAEENQAQLPGTGPDQLTLEILEKHLWAAADKLRGSIDSADYKNYIFGLLFLKRANDRFEEETEEVAEELGIPVETARDDRDLHEEFWIPERARWDYIKAQETDVGAALNKALAAVEDENDPIADRVLTTVDFNDKERLPDSLLSDLVSHFSKHRYRNADLEDPDIFGRAYEYLIREFADDAGKKGGEFYTPREVVRLIVKCVNPEPGHRVYDPCCGSGGMLIYSAEHIRESGGDMTDISLYGQEKNLNTWAIGQMNVLLHELYDAKIEKGDTITDPKRVTKHDELEVFDRVIANPMWNQKEWNKDWVEDNEPYNRFPYGLPPSNRGDWAWIQLMLASLNETGKAGVVMDNGVLFRSRSEKKIRRPILEKDLVEAVIALPENLFYNTSSPGCILILNKDKPEEHEGKVQFIYAEDQTLRESDVPVFEELSNQNQLTDEGVEHIADTYHTGREEDHHSRLVDVEEIEENDWNLNVARYVDTTEPEEPIDVGEKLNELERLAEKRKRIEAELEDHMQTFFSPDAPNQAESDQRKLPEDWKVGQMREFGVEFVAGGTPSRDHEEYFGGDIPWLKTGAVQNSRVTESEEFITNEGLRNSAAKIVPSGSVLVAMYGGGTVGNVGLLQFEATTNQACCAVLTENSELNNEFLYYQLLYEHRRLVSYAAGSSQQNLSKKDVEQFDIVVPPKDEQKRIAKILSTVEKRAEQESQMEQALQELKWGLMQDLLTAKRRINTDI